MRLSQGAPLNGADRARLRALVGDARAVPARTDLAHQGDRPERVHVVLDGVACRYRLTEEGGRSIMNLVLPGDFCDLHVFVLNRMDHSVGTLTECRVVSVAPATLDALTAEHPRIARALWWSTLVDESITREWLVGMGRRRSDRQLAHLFCEMHVRLRLVGRAEPDAFAQPLTLAELGDALGRSMVHVGRSLQTLRDEGLVVVLNRTVMIPDMAALRRYAGFDPSYMHLGALESEELGRVARTT